MKRITFLILCLSFLFQALAFAEIGKSISANQIQLQSESRYKVNETNKSLWMLFHRSGYSNSNNFLKDKKPNTTEFLFISLYKDESLKDVKTDIAFSTKSPPHFVLSKNGIDIGQPFKITEIGTDTINFSIDNKDLLINADKVSFVVTLKNGTTQELELPSEILKDWKYIITSDLKDEYKKGF